MPKMFCLKKSPFIISLFLVMGLTYSPLCQASLFSSFVNHMVGQTKAVIKNPVQAVAKGVNHTVGKVQQGIKSVGQNLTEVGKDLKNGQVGKAVGHLAEATITTITTGEKVLGPLGAAMEGGTLAIITSTVVDAAKNTAINAVIQKLPENQKETAQKAKEGAEAARTVAELIRS